jgi:dipeptidyl aminopeptidase/acylaminoacyl peptidase
MKQTFSLNPEIYHTNQTFGSIDQVTQTNTQASNYLWGTVELVNWLSPSGKELEGLLYKPEGFDPTQKYPMIVYFYEKNSDNLYSYYSPRPSRSVINIPYFVSNGYLVFVPDISYTTAKPGKSAFDCIVSGTLSVCEKGFIDRKRIGLQGQSWGGYQVAYIITQTDLFACAMAGAPVANMTSAYGGIRWESGMSRMFQYEKTQSRIGKNLWEAPFDYLENSPLFYADQITTPLLVMSNDNDGAVPWYQGIELYSAMRRLAKPTWLLNYNGDEHNLKAENYGNRMDLTLRMAQFFGHYLKGAPQPSWMKNGVPALKKGYGSNTN